MSTGGDQEIDHPFLLETELKKQTLDITLLQIRVTQLEQKIRALADKVKP